MNKIFGKLFHHAGFPLLVSIVLLLDLTSIAGQERASDFFQKNITQTQQEMEMNPRFSEADGSILYLEFVGNPAAPQPWDYRLEKISRDGGKRVPLTGSGVIDYNVTDRGGTVLVLRYSGTPYQERPDCEILTEDHITTWEVWGLDLTTETNQLLEASNGRPLSAGRKLLRLPRVKDSNQYVSVSPQATNQVLVRKYFRNDRGFVEFMLKKNSEYQGVFSTEAWKPYAHLNWLPPVTWLGENKFVTVGFQSAVNPRLPQSDGTFSLISVDCRTRTIEMLHRDHRIHPFPKIALAPSGLELFFRKVGQENWSTQIWRLNLLDHATDFIYSSSGDLGEPRFSQDGSKMVFTQMSGSNSDIIYFDFDRYRVDRVASN